MACPRLRRALQVFLWQTLQRSKKSRKVQARRFFRAPQQERRPRRSVQVWRYLRSKLTALSRQGKLELTRRWRVWSAIDNGFHAVTPHPFRCSQSEDILPLEKAYDVHRLSTDGTVAIIFKVDLFFGLLMKATSLVAFPCEGRGTTKWWMSSIHDQRRNSAPTRRGWRPRQPAFATNKRNCAQTGSPHPPQAVPLLPQEKACRDRRPSAVRPSLAVFA